MDGDFVEILLWTLAVGGLLWWLILNWSR